LKLSGINRLSRLSLALLLFSPATVCSATRDAELPDKEMLKMMDFLREMEMLKQMEMMRELDQAESFGEPAKSAAPAKSAPARKKESSK